MPDHVHLIQVQDATGTYSFTYDNMGRTTSAGTQYTFLPGQTFTVQYGYDAASNRTSMTPLGIDSGLRDVRRRRSSRDL